MATREELEKGISEAKSEINGLEAKAKQAESVASKAWDSRDREAFNSAENDRLASSARVVTARQTIGRLEVALEDAGKDGRREPFTSPTGAQERIRKANVAVLGDGEIKRAIASEPEVTGYAVTVAVRQEGKLVETPTVGVVFLGPLFKKVRATGGNGGGSKAALAHYTFSHEGNEYDEAGLVAAFADRVWSGEKLDRVLTSAKGENRIRNSLRVAKELGIAPTTI